MTDVAPSTDAGRAGLRALVADPAGALVAMDFDGTLAPIVDDPGRARPHPEARDALTALGRRVGLVAVVTGRPAGTAAGYLGLRGPDGPGDPAGVVVLGHYGLERWDPATDTVIGPGRPAGVDDAVRALPGLLDSLGLADAYVEDKGASVGVHTRRLTDPADAFARLRAPLQRLADDSGLVLEPGRLVLELRPPGIDKGGALRALVEERDAHTVLFAGDDLGDLAAFDAVDELRTRGRHGLLVCSGSTEEVALASRADIVVDGPDGVVALLRALLALLG